MYYNSLIMRSQSTGDPTQTVWKIVQILSGLGDRFRPNVLILGQGLSESVDLHSPQDIERILQDQRFLIIMEEGPSVSFGFAPARQDIRFYIATGVVDKFIIDFPSQEPITDIVSTNELHGLFRDLAVAYNPFWGCVQNAENVDRLLLTTDPSRRYPKSKVDTSKVPQLIHWFNYFGPAFIERLGGREHLSAGPVWRVEEIESLSGIIWILQQDPLDAYNSEHLARQQDAMRYLRLPEIHKQYQ